MWTAAEAQYLGFAGARCQAAGRQNDKTPAA
jgi:hypothetical protein